MRERILIGFGCVVLLFFVGVKSDVYLGDEAYHYTFAKGIYEARDRISSNPIYAPYPKLDYFYSDVPLWHGLLSGLWWMAGSPSAILAQGYQVLFFLLLGVSSYFLGKRLFGEVAGEMGMILALSAPLVVTFSILLYLDVAVAAWSMFSLWMLHRRKWFYSGIGVGAMLLTKINGLLLLPGFAILLYLHSEPRLMDKTKAFLLVGLPAMMMNLPELYFRKTHFGYFYYVAPKYMPRGGPPVNLFEPSSLYLQPGNLVIYFGVAILICIGLYFGKKLLEQKDLFLWIPIGTYALIFPIFFHYSFPVRNLSLILSPLALLGGKGLASLASKKRRFLILSICFLQFLFVSGTVYLKRQIPEGVKAAFAFVRTQTLKESVFLYPEENLVLYTNRPIVWSHMVEIPKLFWQSDEEGMKFILEKYEVSYVAIKRDRIYDDASVRHTGGYPRSFVEKLPKQSFLKLVFNNSEVSIWEVGS
jgi:hypothetical protein